ncbi:MAG: hypothetical protein GX596_10560 [Propionibacterium sp.]|nr:hypothetical protein [Propionibacterium sp.]
MTNALLPVFGGPPGAHARTDGVFFRPLPWAIGVGAVLFTILYLRHLPCLTTDPANPIDAYIRLCYSDIPTAYVWQGWASGGSPLGGTELTLAPMLAVLVWASLGLARLLGADIGPSASEAEQYAGVPAFFGATAILLFAAFLVLVIASSVIAARQGRPWSIMLVAASPVVLAAGLLSWDLAGLALTALGMCALAVGRNLEAGLLLALAASMATTPLAFALAVVVALGARRHWARLGVFTGAFVPTWILAHLPFAIRNFDAVYGYYHGQVTQEISYGSFWFLLREQGVPLREFGAFVTVLVVLLIAVLIAWIYVTGRRPRVGSLAAAFVLVIVVLAPAYPPQLSLWVLFALFLARPGSPLIWGWSAVAALHYLAVWGWLSGHLTVELHGPELLYYLAVLVRMVAEVGMFVVVLGGLSRPAADPLLGDDDAVAVPERAVAVPPMRPDDFAEAPPAPRRAAL